MIEYSIHPVADVFPMMSDEQLDQLAADIKANGLTHPIVRVDDIIIDGRNRLEACRRANVVPTFEDVQVDDVRAYIISANINRRNLSKRQLAAIAADLATLGYGTNRYQKKVEGPNGPSTLRSLEQAAMECGVGRRSVVRAKKFARENPEAHEAIKRGEKPPVDENKKTKESGDYWNMVALNAYTEETGKKRSQQWIRNHIKPVLEARLPWFSGRDNRALLLDSEVQDIRNAVKHWLADKDQSSDTQLEQHAETARQALAKTAQEKLDIAIRAHKRLLDREFEERVRQETTRSLNEDILPTYAQEYERYKAFTDTYKGVFTYSEFKMLKGFLHPDRHPGDPAKAGKLFQLIADKEEILCGIKESEKANRPSSLPKTVAEMIARRRSH